MKHKLLVFAGAFVLVGAAAAGILDAYWAQAVPIAGMTINYFWLLSAPLGTTTTELAAASRIARENCWPVCSRGRLMQAVPGE